MALQASQPDNKNFLSPIGFRFSIQKLPHVNYFCTQASVPTMQLSDLEIETPFIKLPIPGTKISFNTLDIQFRIDEDLKNFREIYDWLVSIGFPDNFEQRAPLQRPNFKVADEAVYSDASLMIMTNQYKPNIEVKFIDLYPISLSSIDFDLAAQDVSYLNASVSFQYRKYELITVT